MSSQQPGPWTCADETTWIDLVLEAEPIDERTWKDALAVDDCETTALDLRPPEEIAVVEASPPPDQQVLEARLAIRAALKDAHHARITAQQAQAQTALTRMLIARLDREATCTQQEVQRCVTQELINRTLRWMTSCRARAYRAARRAQATTAAARRACLEIGLTAEAFQHAFELSVKNQAALEQVPTAV